MRRILDPDRTAGRGRSTLDEAGRGYFPSRPKEIAMTRAEAFAVAALEELAETDRILLISLDDRQAEPPSETSA